jgi:pimeloyl-ACP methyl ester carboxylesterase
MAMKHFAADDGELIHLDIAGSGSPVVMLHGWTSSHLEWSPFVPGLTEHHRVLRWDARGHGGHPLTRATPPTVQRMAQDLRNLIDHFDLNDIALVGHSMGALTLWEYVRAHGTAGIARVCLIDQSPKLLTDEDWEWGIYGDFDCARAERFATELEHNFAEAVLRLTAHGLNSRAREKYEENARGWQRVREALQKLHPAPLIDTWKSLTEADYREVLEKIDVPALLIYGGDSNFYHRETARFVHERIRHAVLHVYEGTDHSPHQWERERFQRDLLAFLDPEYAPRAMAAAVRM